ncbi:Butanol dehydrogenase bdhA [Bacillus subtilis]|nr:Butanol dehydrogenase bdhA [Bacillus subtilis]
MENFTYYNPTKLIFGKGQLEQLRKEFKRYGKNVLLVYGAAALNATAFMIKSQAF